MSEAAKVRLVRCPKCQNLLPELTDYSVYQCGGCGAVLRASKMNGNLDTFSEKSDEDGVGGVSGKSENINFSDKRMMNLSEGSENDVKSNASSSSRAERRRVVQDRAEDRTNMKSNADKWEVDEGADADRNIDELNHVNMEKEFDDFKPPDVDENGLRRSGHMADRKIRDRGEIEGFLRAERADIERRRYQASKYSEEGPSNYYSDVCSSYGEPLKNRSDGHGFDKVEYAGDDRAELLRKLDELKDKLSRSCEVAEKPKDKISHHSRPVHHDPYGGPEDWFSDSSSGINRPYMQYPVPDQHMARPSYINQYAEPSPYINMHGMGSHHGFYPPVHLRSHIQGSGDPLSSQMPRRGPQHAPAPFQEQPAHGYFPGHYMNNGMVHMDSFETYPPNQHHLSCTCFYCYKKNQVLNNRFSGIPNNPVSYHHENTGSFGPRDYGPRTSNMPSFKSHNLQSHTRWPSDVDSEVSSFVPRRPPRVHPSTRGQHYRPIAGGAPFVTCYNCFESLQVPKKVLVKDSNQKRMRCGSCSSIIVFEVSHKTLFISTNGAGRESTPNAENNRKVMLNEGNSHTQGHPNRASLTFSSDDYDHSGYDFQSMDRELVSQSTDQPGSAKSAGMKSLRSTSSSTSEDEATLDHTAASGKNSDPTELPTKSKSPPPPAGSSLQDYFEYSNKYHRGKRFENGNRSKRLDPETVMTKKTTSPQDSIKDASEATEMEISSNEYGNTGTSLGSGEPSREGDQLKANKAAESFFAGIIKKSFRDSNRSNQKIEQEKASVTVNGHLIPDRLIKKAEKVAGPIQPGNYWYDFRAGFWGMMGGPCLGIIPPFIEEFNYRLPENCAGGNTSVFVNGRELHQRDLNLLASRGLPTERNRSYVIEMSGRVLDEETGDELESLGKLAPTVERVKHGFGMKPPKAAA